MRCRGVVAMAWARKVLACGAVWMSSSPRIATSMAWVPIGRALIAKPSLSTSSGMGACSFDRANRTSCPDGLDRLTRTSSSRKVIQPGQAAARGEPAARHDRPLALKLPAWVSSSPPSRSKNIAVEEQGTTGPARALRAVFGAGNLCRHGHVRPSSRTGRRLPTALNAKDADELGELFIDDAEFVNIMGMRMRRRQGIVNGHGWAFAGPLRGRRVHFDQVDELRVTDDVTVLIGHCVREREPDAPVAGLPDGASVLVFVTRREPQSWRIAAATNVTESTPTPG